MPVAGKNGEDPGSLRPAAALYPGPSPQHPSALLPFRALQGLPTRGPGEGSGKNHSTVMVPAVVALRVVWLTGVAVMVTL